MGQRRSTVPGAGWRWLRRSTQSLVVVGVLLAPMLGGWQRMDRAELATVEDEGWNLPRALLDVLPAGEPAARAYRSNRVLGGGTAADYLGVPAMDPVAGALAMIGRGWTWQGVVAVGLPMLLALAGGRMFCGWMCVFGVLARALDRLVLFFPFLPRWRLPASRPLRFVVLGGCVFSSLLGLHVALYFTLPYVLVQQSVYAAWLLGGGSIALSVLLGLVVAGVIFGPTLYCAALCPTGATLGVLGRARVVRLQVIDTPACGSKCGLCNQACWLQLQPRSGDPGPDCDLCARCVPVCPKNNLDIRIGWKARAPVAKAAALLFAFATTLPASSGHAEGLRKPTIVLERELRIGETTVAISALDIEGTTLNRDWGVDQRGTDINVYLTRGRLKAPGELGIIEGRRFHTGPLTVEVRTPGRGAPVSFDLPRANHPISAQRPSIYRQHVPQQLRPGDSIAVHPVRGYLEEAVEVSVTRVGTTASLVDHLQYFFGALLTFCGLLALALGLPTASAEPPRAPKHPGAAELKHE